MSVLQEIVKSGTLRESANGPVVKIVQEALRRAGHELVVDGDFGTITRVAVERFQAAAKIAPDGMVGPITATYLDAVKPTSGIPTTPMPSVLKAAPWLAYMRALTGTKEIPGAKSNPLILSWIRTLSARYPTLKPNIGWYSNDDIPWCGVAVGEAVGDCDPGYMPPLLMLQALAWGPWGQDAKAPIQGAIAVKKRKGGGHVTLVEGISPNGKILYCRGGNQSNMINVAEYPRDVFHTFRWPTGALLPKNMKPTIIANIASLGKLASNVTEA